MVNPNFKTKDMADAAVFKEKAEQAVKSAQDRLGPGFKCWALLTVPFAIVVVLGMLTVSVAYLVFGIQGLVVGADTYRSCNEVGVWMIVFGSLVVGGCVLSCCCKRPKKEAKEEQDLATQCEDHEESQENGFVTLIQLATFGWLCYGMYLVYNEPAQRMACNQSQFDVFALIVKFCFFGCVAVVGSMCLLCCCCAPVFAKEMMKNDRNGECCAHCPRDVEAQVSPPPVVEGKTVTVV